MPEEKRYDVAVVGGGPAGSVAALLLARGGVDVVVLESARFPREKVCGDFIEPGGLRILGQLGCLDRIEADAPLPIDQVRIFVRSEAVYSDRVHYYDGEHGLPRHAFIVPRHRFDHHLLEAAREASATVLEETRVTAVTRERQGLRLALRRSGHTAAIHARLVIGADGAGSVVARSFGLLRQDPRTSAISQRGYVEGVELEGGEAAVFFDDDLFPGYGWLFPMADGVANVGVGIHSESCRRYRISVPERYAAFLDLLRRSHPGCAEIRALGKPLGGVVKTYAGIGPNYFDGGMLVGDAGCFVDPMTGEGITQAMESAAIAAETSMAVLEEGRTDAAALSRFESAFRSYFDPSMSYLSLCAAILRNRHLRDFWLSTSRRVFLEARENPEFARIAGATFGGAAIRPLSILSQGWAAAVSYAFETGIRPFALGGRGTHRDRGDWLGDLWKLQRGLRNSWLDSPRWHLAWQSDVLTRWWAVRRHLVTDESPRHPGLALTA